jgi:hypothetical protein
MVGKYPPSSTGEKNNENCFKYKIDQISELFSDKLKHRYTAGALDRSATF